MLLAADAEGNPFAIRTVRASLTLDADGQSIDGEFEATIADPAGNVMATEAGMIRATRIIAEAPGTLAPATVVGTPTA